MIGEREGKGCGQLCLPYRMVGYYLAGLACGSPFTRRTNDKGWDSIELIGQIANLFKLQKFKTGILATSIRNANHN